MGVNHYEDAMPKFRLKVKCDMLINLAVEAESEEKVREWFDKKPQELYSLIESPSQEAYNIVLEKIQEFGWAKVDCVID